MFEITLGLSILLCALVGGFLFSYAVVIMPGIRTLDDKAFIQAFQVTDQVIQNNNPLFLLMWVGSALAVIACTVLGFSQLSGLPLVLLIIANGAYFIGVQVSTAVINLPLNNALQKVDTDNASADELQAARQRFEPRWNQANRMRTVIAIVSSALLLGIAFQLA